MPEVTSGQIENVHSGQVSSGSRVDSGGTQQVFSSGESVSALISGGTQTVFAGGYSSAATLISGGVLVLLGSAAGLFASSGGSAFIYNGGVSEGGEIYSGGVEFVSSGGSSTDEVTGSQYVYSGGRASDDVAGVQYVSGGTVTGGGPVFGGVVSVFRGGSSFFESVKPGGTEVIASGGVVSETFDSGTLTLLSGAIGGSDIIESGGRETISRGATESRGSSVDATQYVSGFVQSETILGGLQFVYSGGEILSDSAGDVQVTVFSGGQALDTDLFSTNSQFSAGLSLQSGASATGTIVTEGCLEFLSVGAVASDTTIDAGGVQINHGLTVAATISLGGSAIVAGEADFTQIASGGRRDRRRGRKGCRRHGGRSADPVVRWVRRPRRRLWAWRRRGHHERRVGEIYLGGR